MKKYILLLATALFFSSISQALVKIKCKEDLSMSDLEFLRMRYTIELNEIKDISKQVKHADNAYVVDVTVGREDELGGNTEVIKSFQAVSSSEDVYYTMSSVKKNGVKFYLFLDEYDQAGMTIVDENGQSQKVRMTCESEE